MWVINKSDINDEIDSLFKKKLCFAGLFNNNYVNTHSNNGPSNNYITYKTYYFMCASSRNRQVMDSYFSIMHCLI